MKRYAANETDLLTCGAADYVDEIPGSKEAMLGVFDIATQSAGIAAVCALALDSLAYSRFDNGPQVEDVAAAASQLLFKCWDDLTVAANLVG